MTGEVTHAIRAMRESVDPIRGNIEQMLTAPVERHPDAELIELGEQWAAAEAVYQRAIHQWSAAEETINRPDAPEAVFLRESDRVFKFDRLAVQRSDERRWYYLGEYDKRANACLRRQQKREVRREVRPEDDLPADAIAVSEMVPWPEKQVRADEITQAWDQWRAEIWRLEEQSDLHALSAAVRETCRCSVALADQIEAASAHTVAGLRVKARVARSIDEDGFAVGPEFWAGLVRDILNLAAMEVSA